MYFKNAVHSFFWGIITAGMSLVFQLAVISLTISSKSPTEIDNVFLGSLFFLIIYAFSEESFKYFIVTKKIIPISYGRGFLINSWLAGIGFALLEVSILYQKNIYEKIDFQFIDLFETVPLHILTFGILGYFLAISEVGGLNLKVLSFNFFVHFIYNYSIIYLDKYSFYITSALVISLFLINIYSFIIVNKKLASD